MSDNKTPNTSRSDDISYEVNTGGATVHARRMKGRWRNIKWLVMGLIYLPLFILPYIPWGDRPAILWDIPNRKFYFFDLTVWPQDFFILALILLFCFMLLFAMTAIAGRIFCGFICPQTIWIDIMTWIEDRVEGSPKKRAKLDNSPWNADKIIRRGGKHVLFMGVCVFTAIHAVAYFSGIWDLYAGLATFNLKASEWVSLLVIVVSCYVDTGLIREQFCMWVCPYARIQGVFTDQDTQVISYDHHRGEQRGRMKRGKVAEGHGDCIDCNLCVVTCPTGVDIRLGQQIGCINCGICADACDSVMDKISRPSGLIRFASFHEIEENVKVNNPYLRPRPLFYAAVTLFAVVGIVYGLATKTVLDINVRHERSPQFTMMSNGSIQNVYHLDILNKTDQPADFIITITGLDGITSNVDDKIFHLKTAQVKRFIMLTRVPRKQLTQESHPVTITLQSKENPEIKDVYKSMFIGPK